MTDAELHVHRVSEIMDAVRSGVLYTRWAPHFYYGYGYPVFNYYAPLTYYLAAGYAFLTGLGPVAGIKLVFVLGFFLGGAGMYLFVRDQWGGPAGVASCAALLFSPYLVFIDPHARGDAPEFFALTVAPLALWSLSRLLRSGSYGDAVLAALTMAGLALSHPLIGPGMLLFVAAWAGWGLWLGRSLEAVPLDSHAAGGASDSTSLQRRKSLLLLSVAVALALGLSAFWWLPAVLERSAVRYQQVAGPGFFDFHRNFVGLGEVLASSQTFDLAATQVRFHFNLGVSLWVLGLAGLLTLALRRTRQAGTIYFGFSALAAVYLILPASVQVWEAVSPLRFFQFPSRFLGPAALALAVLTGASVRWGGSLHPRWGSLAWSVLAVCAAVGLALPLLFPPAWGEYGPVTPARILQEELSGRALGTTSADDFLPAAVRVVPPRQDSLVASILGGEPLGRVNRATLPDGAQVVPVSLSPLDDTYQVSSPADFVFRSFTFDFPGWTAYVDGREVPIEAAEPDGLITFSVPAGNHRVAIRMEDTPPRTAAWVLAGMSVLGLAALLAAEIRGRRPDVSRLGMPLEAPGATFFGVVLILFAGFRAVAESRGWFTLHSAGDHVLPAEREQYAVLGDQIALLAYDLPVKQARPGQGVPITLYWKKAGQITESYQVFIHLVGPDGVLYGQSDKLNPADFPTSLWPDDRYVRDEHTAVLQRDAPPGPYQVNVGLWVQSTGQRLEARTAGGEPLGDRVALADSLQVLP